MTTTIIAPASWGAYQSRLTKGSDLSFSLALEIARQQKNPLIVWGAASRVCEETERKIKLERLADAGAGVKWIDVGGIVSTIDEAEKAKSVLAGGRVTFDEIFLVTEKFHAWGAKLIWQKNFPGVAIRTVTFPTKDVIERDHPVASTRSGLAWQVLNLVRYLVLKLGGDRGYRFLKALREPIVE